MAIASRVSIAILAKAPIPGFAKTRLIPSIGANAAAMLQEQFTKRAATTALAADLGPVTLWCTPDPAHTTFRELATQHKIALKRQPEGDLGARMLAAIDGPTLVIGTDCPALTTDNLRAAVQALHDGTDVVLIPAEDGGYVLIGARTAQPELFADIAWGTETVLAETRAKISALNLSCAELPTLWDVDTEADLARFKREFPELVP